MNVIKKQGVWRLFDKHVALILTDEKQLEIIVNDPNQPLFDDNEQGFSGEKDKLYRNNTSLVDICREAQKAGAERVEVSYDFFFGGSRRYNYPDSDITVKAFRVIHDMAAQHGMAFSASIISPLDIGGGYAQRHDKTGYSYQYKEGIIDVSSGNYSIDMVLQKQWYNNKGPIELELDKVLVYAFCEERIEDTYYYYVNADEIMDISHTASYDADEKNIVITRAGYGYGALRIFGKYNQNHADKVLNRCLAVAVYKTPELDYFSSEALPYMKSVIDLHKEAGITYQGFYSDEMHIQFDWDLVTHFGHDEINTRYITSSLMNEYAWRYGDEYRDFAKYLIYFAYHQHDFMDNEEGKGPSQHVLGKNEESIYKTWLFRKRYFEMLQSRVVEISVAAKDYAEQLFGAPIMTRAHATWQESPTCDHFFDRTKFSERDSEIVSRYDYTPEYVWSSSIRENISACYDYFKWNDFLTGSGNDHPEGGNTDRNYYAQALACSFGVLNKFPYAYCGAWGSPKEVLRRLHNVGSTYGNMDWTVQQGHNLVQGISHRVTDVLALYPLELNYVEEKFGSWMVQYGYCNYITEEKLLDNAHVTDDGTIMIKGRSYRAILVLFEPFIKEETLKLLEIFVAKGGKVIWTSIYPVLSEENTPILSEWKKLFGIGALYPACRGITAQNNMVQFEGDLAGIAPMKIPTNLLPDFVYPIKIVEDAHVVARCDDYIVGTMKEYPNGGLAVYLGFRPRDDQSQSTGKDVDTLFAILSKVDAYSKDSLEMLSRPEDSRYIMNIFLNGTISIANHYRTFYEDWSGQFFRDSEQDAQFLKGRQLPPVEIQLKGNSIKGHVVSYEGIDVLSYNVGQTGKLLGFAGNETMGITIDGKSYWFTNQPADIAWTVVPSHYIGDGVAELYMIRVNKAISIHIPLPIDTMREFMVEVCDEDVFNTSRAMPYNWAGSDLNLDITENEINKWIAVYRKK